MSNLVRPLLLNLLTCLLWVFFCSVHGLEVLINFTNVNAHIRVVSRPACDAGFVLCVSLKTCYESRMYQLRIECGTDYPDRPPNVWFITRVNMKSVESNGRVCSTDGTI